MPTRFLFHPSHLGQPRRASGKIRDHIFDDRKGLQRPTLAGASLEFYRRLVMEAGRGYQDDLLHDDRELGRERQAVWIPFCGVRMASAVAPFVAVLRQPDVNEIRLPPADLASDIERAGTGAVVNFVIASDCGLERVKADDVATRATGSPKMRGRHLSEVAMNGTHNVHGFVGTLVVGLAVVVLVAMLRPGGFEKLVQRHATSIGVTVTASVPLHVGYGHLLERSVVHADDSHFVAVGLAVYRLRVVVFNAMHSPTALDELVLGETRPLTLAALTSLAMQVSHRPLLKRSVDLADDADHTVYCFKLRE